MTYEEKIARIEEIIRQLNTGKAPLQESLQLKQEATRLLNENYAVLAAISSDDAPADSSAGTPLQ
jgi:exodeoxyribonuclease VII small subunit